MQLSLFLIYLYLPSQTYICVERGAVVEWLERLALVRKVTGSSPTRAKILENSHCPPSSKWVHD